MKSLVFYLAAGKLTSETATVSKTQAEEKRLLGYRKRTSL
jgi:hypothetical protein